MLPDLPDDEAMRISSRRLDLVPLTAEDAEDLFPVLNDPAIGRFTGETPPADVEAVRAGFTVWEARRSPDGSELWLNWVVRRRDDGRAVGYVQATVGEADAAIAWTIGTAYQRQGFATEAGHALIAWLRDGLHVPTIVGSVHPDNIASQTAARRIGLRPTDRLHDGEVVWEYVPPGYRRTSGRIEVDVPRSSPRSLILFALLGGAVAFTVAALGSTQLALAAGLVCFAIGMAMLVWRSRSRSQDDPSDPGRRRFLTLAGLGGFAWLFVGGAFGRATRSLTLPDPGPIQDAMASDLGAEYMELIRRAYHPGRSGELQLVLAPYNSANYAPESRDLVRFYRATSHASVWMYLERVPLVVHAPGRVQPSDDTARVTLADIAPTTAAMMGFTGWPADREGAALPGIDAAAGATPPKVIVTFVIDGGGWNVLQHWPDRWPNLKRLMGQGANYRNAITGSFPAVTACAHATIGTGTFPNQHGITGHNIRDGSKVRKAYGDAGHANPGDILIPTLADLWSDETDNRAWVGEIGYQVWHMGMIGHGGTSRGGDQLPVGVYWNEGAFKQNGIGGWAPHNPDLFRMPTTVPGLDVYDAHLEAFTSPEWDRFFDPRGRQTPCCAPPVVKYQGDLIDATLRSEPIGGSGVTDLLYINFKAPDYTGHIYNMKSDWEGLILEEVDAQLGRLVATLDERFPGEYALIVTADHGQCPLPDDLDGVRLDPVQLGEAVDQRFGGELVTTVQSVVPSEIYLHEGVLRLNGASIDDVAVALRDYRYRQNIGPYVPQSAIEQELLDSREFSAVFSTTYLASLENADLSVFGETAFPDGDPDGIPEIP